MKVCNACRAKLAAGHGLALDADQRMVVWTGGEVRLGRTAYRLLSSLAGAVGRVVRLAEVIDTVWGDDVDGGPLDARKAVYVQMCYLRRRLAASSFPGRILTHAGCGYELVLQ